MQILDLYYSPELEMYFSTAMKNNFLSSEYAKKMINHDLINKIENDLEIELDEEEKAIVLFILRISTKSLITTLKLINRQGEIEHSKIKDFLFTSLEETINSDTKNRYYYPPYPFKIGYEKCKFFVEDINNQEYFILKINLKQRLLNQKYI